MKKNLFTGGQTVPYLGDGIGQPVFWVSDHGISADTLVTPSETLFSRRASDPRNYLLKGSLVQGCLIVLFCPIYSLSLFIITSTSKVPISLVWFWIHSLIEDAIS